MAEQQQHGKAVQTTGHAWDGDLQEFNNPLPTWWLWTFYATCVFAAVYWVLFPTWPLGKGFTTGVKTITYEQNGEQVTTHWNTRALLIAEMQTGEEALKQKAYLEKVSAASFDEIVADPEMMAFTRSMAKGLFGDNCAACHGGGGVPAMIGQYPNLADDAWLWGGKIEQIQESIINGRQGYMPGFGSVLSAEQIDALGNYVMSLSGEPFDGGKVSAGKKLFQGQEGGCHHCHTVEATGLASLGAANLTDAIWTVADVPGATSKQARLEAIKAVISNGVQRKMPAWKDRLGEAEIKLLTVYVHGLGGGQ